MGERIEKLEKVTVEMLIEIDKSLRRQIRFETIWMVLYIIIIPICVLCSIKAKFDGETALCVKNSILCGINFYLLFDFGKRRKDVVKTYREFKHHVFAVVAGCATIEIERVVKE